MLFPLIKRVDWTNPLRGAYQFVMIGVMGVCLYFYDGSLVNIGQKPVPISVGSVAKSSDLDSKMAELLKTNTLSDHEDLYKIFKGISEYSKNAINIDTTLDVYKGIESVSLNHFFITTITNTIPKLATFSTNFFTTSIRNNC